MWRIIVLKWDSLVLSLTSLFYGYQLFTHPEILKSYDVYKLLDNLFDQRFISIFFIILGLLKLVGVIGNYKYVKRWSLVLLTFVWTLFGVSFLLSEPPNTVWIFALSMSLLSMGIAIREE